jgi:hypothetical protein
MQKLPNGLDLPAAQQPIETTLGIGHLQMVTPDLLFQYRIGATGIAAVTLQIIHMNHPIAMLEITCKAGFVEAAFFANGAGNQLLAHLYRSL